jgi:hypothetical protein
MRGTVYAYIPVSAHVEMPMTSLAMPRAFRLARNPDNPEVISRSSRARWRAVVTVVAVLMAPVAGMALFLILT